MHKITYPQIVFRVTDSYRRFIVKNKNKASLGLFLSVKANGEGFSQKDVSIQKADFALQFLEWSLGTGHSLCKIATGVWGGEGGETTH